MSSFNIDKGVPLPDKECGPKSPIRATIRSMEVGDSFYINRKMSLLCHYRGAADKAGAVITMRKEGAGTRIWRIK